MSRLVKVIVINSLSYTGSTWVNTILASHPSAFNLGPADRVFGLRTQNWEDACRVHGKDCPFWPAFHRHFDAKQNFFVQLAKFSGKDYIVTNNPQPNGAGKELSHPDIEVKNVQLVRDGRALLASYLRKHAEADFHDAMISWLASAFHSIPFDPDNPDTVCLRHEDILADPHWQLARVGQYVGLNYSESATRFWEYEHHTTGGNQGFISLIKQGQGIPIKNFKDHEFYREQFERIKAGGSQSFRDERWCDELSRANLFLFDLCLGSDNERLGYPRDRFTVAEFGAFFEELKGAINGRSISLRDLKGLDGTLFDQLDQLARVTGASGVHSSSRPETVLLAKLFLHHLLRRYARPLLPALRKLRQLAARP